MVRNRKLEGSSPVCPIFIAVIELGMLALHVKGTTLLTEEICNKAINRD